MLARKVRRTRISPGLDGVDGHYLPTYAPVAINSWFCRTMTDSVDSLILDLVDWLARAERTYEETMDAWRTSCPRLTVWEDACDRGYVEHVIDGQRMVVRPTSVGLAFLTNNRPNDLRVTLPSP